MKDVDKAQCSSVDFPREHIALAFSALRSCGSPDAGRGEFKRAIELIPEQDASARQNSSYALVLSLWGMHLERLGSFDEARGAYERALKLEPFHSLAHGNLPKLLEAIDADAALKMYEKHVEVFPRHISVWMHYATFLKGRGDIRGTEACFRSALGACPDHPTCLSRFAVFLHGALGKYDEAEEMYERAIAADAANATCLSNYGLFQADVRDSYERAASLYEAALAVDACHANALYNYGVLLDTDEAHGDKEKALEMYRRASEAAPNHGFAWHNLAVLLSAKDDDDSIEEAQHAFREALRANPDDAKTAEDFGGFLAFKWGKIEEGEKWIKRALELNPSSGTAWTKLGNIYKSPRCPQCDFSEARKCFEAAIEHDPFIGDAHGSLGTIYADVDNNIPAAEAAYRRAIELNPSCEHLVNTADFFADVLVEEIASGEREAKDILREARDLYERAITASPRNVYAHQNYGGFLVRAAQDGVDIGVPNVSEASLYARAEELYMSALRVSPADSVCLTNLGVVYWRHKKDYDAAEKCFKAALEGSPDDPSASAHYSAFKRDVGR